MIVKVFRKSKNEILKLTFCLSSIWLYQRHHWSPNQKYLKRKDYGKIPHRHYTLHRELFNLQDPEKHVDHINHDTYDNRLENLRIGTKADNARNSRKRKDSTSPYKGVQVRGKNKDIFRAYIYINKKRVLLGNYKTAEEAALAYDNKAKTIHKEYACLNFPKY